MALTSNEVEAANRAEVTAVLIRAGYRVYRPEADVSGEDLVIRTTEGQLLSVQMKGRPTVDQLRYGDRNIWMLFPDPIGSHAGREWFLVPHDKLFEWMKDRHGSAPSWDGAWNYPRVTAELRAWLHTGPFQVPASLPDSR